MGRGEMVALWLEGSSCLLYRVFQQGDRSLSQSNITLRRLVNSRSGQFPGRRREQAPMLFELPGVSQEGCICCQMLEDSNLALSVAAV